MNVMKKEIKYMVLKKLGIIGLLLGTTVLSFAQTSDVKNYYNPLSTGVPSLLISPDARAGGMGDVGVATSPDINSQHWNPAKYAFAESVAGASLSYTPWLRKIVKDIDLVYLSGYYKFLGPQAVSMSLRYFSLGEISLTDNEGNPMGTGKPNEFSIDVAYSRQLSKHFSMAVAMRYIYSNLSAKDENYYPGHAFGADIAMYAHIPLMIPTGESLLGVGLNISNISTKISYDKGETPGIFLPANMRLGIAYTVPFDAYNKLSMSFDINKLLVPAYPQMSNYVDSTGVLDNDAYETAKKKYNRSSVAGIFYSFADAYDNPKNTTAKDGFMEELREINWSAGLEYSYNNQFFVRTGYSNESKWKGNRKYFTFGAGFKFTAFQLDVGYVLALAQTSPLDQTLRFGLSFDVDGLRDLVDMAERRKK